MDICEACAEDPHRKDIDCKHRTDMCKFPAEDVCKCLGGKQNQIPDPVPKHTMSIFLTCAQ